MGDAGLGLGVANGGPLRGTAHNMDIAQLLEPIDTEEPCGPNLEYDAEFLAMDQASKGKEEQRVGDSVAEGEPADWRAVKSNALSLLERTRDLRVLLYLAQAGLRTDGFATLAGSLELLAGFAGKFWDQVHPQLDPDFDNDPIQRVNILNSFVARETMLLPIDFVVLVRARAGRFCLRDIQVAQGSVAAPEGAENVPDTALIDAAFIECDLEELEGLAADAQRALDQLGAASEAVGQVLDATLTPDWTPLRKKLEEISGVLRGYLVRRGAVADDGAGQDEEAGGQPAGQGAVPSRVDSREEVIRVLDLACDYFERNEPSSPVPILLRRAKRLVTKDFMEILRDLTPDGVSQAEFFEGSEPE